MHNQPRFMILSKPGNEVDEAIYIGMDYIERKVIMHYTRSVLCHDARPQLFVTISQTLIRWDKSSFNIDGNLLILDHVLKILSPRVLDNYIVSYILLNIWVFQNEFQLGVES